MLFFVKTNCRLNVTIGENAKFPKKRIWVSISEVEYTPCQAKLRDIESGFSFNAHF